MARILDSLRYARQNFLLKGGFQSPIYKDLSI